MANEEKKTSSKATSPAPRILEQGKPFDHIGAATPKLGTAGQYKVTHGVVSFGYAKDADGITTGTAQVAYPGAVIELTAEEAGPLVAAKTVEFVRASA